MCKIRAILLIIIIMLLNTLLFNVVLYATNSTKYAIINFDSLGMSLKDYSNTIFGSGTFQTIYNSNTKNKELELLPKKECKETIYKNIIKDEFKYLKNGIYSEDGAYGRYICLDENIARKYFSQKIEFFHFKYDLFFKKYPTQIPQEFKPEKFQTIPSSHLTKTKPKREH